MNAAATIWSRPEAIARLRETLVRLADNEHSMCQVAADRGIFCHGFRRWDSREFDRRWKQAIGRSTYLTRAQMEEFANVWQLAEQIRRGVSLACATRTHGSGPCRGWDAFSYSDLSRFCADILGRNVVVTDRPFAP